MKLTYLNYTMEDGRGECSMRVEGAMALLCPLCGVQVRGEHHCQSPRPKRIQRKRTKGWRAPEGTVNATRPGPLGNPFKIGRWYAKGDVSGRGERVYTESLVQTPSRRFKLVENAAQAVQWYRWYLAAISAHPRIVRELRGKDLMCWCALDQPCHADVLLEIANG